MFCVKVKGTRKKKPTGGNWIFPMLEERFFFFFFLFYRQQQGWHGDVMTGENHGQRVEKVLVSALPLESETIPVTILCTSDKKLMWPTQLIDQVIE